jgi:uncharacterized protein YdbL (DUF1318 family)
MTTRRSFPLSAFLAALALLAVGAAAASAADLGALKKSFQERYPKLKKAKEEGKIGETYLGHVEAVKEEYLKDAAIKKLIDDENADRKTLYQAIAEKEGITPEKVAARNAVRNFERAKPDEWLKPSDGKWVQKKNLKD